MTDQRVIDNLYTMNEHLRQVKAKVFEMREKVVEMNENIKAIKEMLAARGMVIKVDARQS